MGFSFDGYQLISVAALLHDIGKMAHRAGIEIKNDFNIDEYCPKNEHGKPIYRHAAYTAEFLDWFEKEFGIKTEDGDIDKNLVNVAAYHHKSGTGGALAEMIREADRLSSGFEREDRHESGRHDKDNLESIFSEVSLGAKHKVYYYPLEKLNPTVVPVEDSSSDNRDAYRKLYDGFRNDLRKIPKNARFDVFWDALEYIYEIYAWSVPSSSYRVYPRISLFDHSKTTAAIAQALYGYHKESADFGIESVKDRSKDKFLLVQGDFAGIQNFIFSRMGSSNKFAAKILRARSFFVSLACDMVAYRICKELNLTKAAMVMSAGGKITLLLPNTPKSIEVVYRIEDEINREFKGLTFGETRFSLACISLNGNDFIGGNFSKKMGELVIELEKRKLRPDTGEYVFWGYLDEVKNKGVCEICGKHPADYTLDGANICKYCKRFKEIGEELVKRSYFVIRKDEKEADIFGEFKVSFAGKDLDLKSAILAFDLDKTGEFKGVAKSKIAGYVPKVSEEEIRVGIYDKLDKDEMSKDVKTFAMIAEDAKKPDEKGNFVGESFLGVLKADVDNLGRIFIEGIKGNVTISKVASLSRMIDFFFTGWLQYKIKKDFPSVYTVFSGGDDLFLIGPFDQIVELALEINKHLKEYAKNSDIHLSCGIYFVKPKVPVYHMAGEAEERLDKAKNEGKNRIAIFGRVVEWKRFEEMMEDEEIRDLLENDDILSTSKKYSLFDFAYKAGWAIDKREGGGSRRDLMWKPLLVYQLWRNVKVKDRKEKAEVLDKVVGFIEKYRADFVVPLSYYIYTTRRR